MATILLQAAGGALGGLVGGPFGAVAGRALGALGGYALDNRLLGKTTRREGARLSASRVLEADEGGGVARLYGTARIAGQVIWTTRFEEIQSTERQGGKGGRGGSVETTSYSYFGHVAIGLCEGPVACVRRIWADGEEMDLSDVSWRLHRGDETQMPDPLIEAKQGIGNAPAYRGLAYVVFERLALERWGNRIPQIACEVIRPVGQLERNIRAVTIIPGATEHGLDPVVVRERLRPGEDKLLNRNVLHGASDFAASLDELTALCPRLERAALVVAWFADDLRAGRAHVRPGVETRARDETSEWRVGPTGRAEAHLVSQVDGGPAYGGTPSDAGVVRSIATLRARGLKVTYYPFVLMDVPVGNGLPDPYGAAMQAPYPWRGRMTLDLAETMGGSADGTMVARADIERFVGSAQPGHFSVGAGRVEYGGAAEWSYRRMILHQAHIAKLAGGVDAFVVGSEMRGLTRIRDAKGAFPFVEALIALAREVKAILPDALITYAADWSEYFGYQPADGSGDVFYNLDPLWADPVVGAVGIDNYLPLSDWRTEDAEGEGRDGLSSPYDRDGLRAGIESGEHADWYYASEADRRAMRRTPITDGLGKPWVFKPKDLRSWWRERHFERWGGVEQAGATAWVPMSKPIWITELGCPAIDKGANQPNVFVDPKSSENAFPHFSTGARDDLQQRRFLEAHQIQWDEAVPGFEEVANPVSPLYGGRMVPADAVHLWTWDARPYPAFPERGDIWRDGANWERGHWLSGRLGRAPLDGLIAALLADHGFCAFDVSQVDAEVGGYLVGGPGTARGELEELLRLTGVEAWAEGGVVRFRSADRALRMRSVEALVDEADVPLVEVRRAEAGETAQEIVVGFSDPARAYQSGAADATLGDAGEPVQATVELPVVLAETQARQFAERLLLRETGERESASFALSPAEIGIMPGDALALPGTTGRWVVERVEDGLSRRMEARRRGRGAPTRLEPSAPPPSQQAAPVFASRPVVHFLDLPKLGAFQSNDGARIAVGAKPWVPYELLSSPTGSSFEPRGAIGQSATLGWLVDSLAAGSEAVLDRTNGITVDLLAGALQSVSVEGLRAGANLAAIRGRDERWEVLQFQGAEEIASGRFRLSVLVRGLGGTADAATGGIPAGAPFVLLDRGTRAVPLTPRDAGRALTWLVVPSGRALDDAAMEKQVRTLGRQAVRPLSPVHLGGSLSGDAGLSLRWIRRTRSTDDAWEGVDVPLDEETEAYRVVLSAGGAAPVVFEARASAWSLPAAALAEAFGSIPQRLDVEIAQISQSAGAGAPGHLILHRR